MIKSLGYANRGRSLEDLINYSNEQYRAKGVALIQKVATPWTVIRRGKQIVSAFPAEKSTVDFIGVVHEKIPIAFDAKQCKEETRFPLSYIEHHQMVFLKQWSGYGGEAFFVIEMIALREIFRVPYGVISKYWEDAQSGGRKSIPIDDFKKMQPLKSANGIVLDYLGLMGRKEVGEMGRSS